MEHQAYCSHPMTLCYMKSLVMSQGTMLSRLYSSALCFVFAFERWPEEMLHISYFR